MAYIWELTLSAGRERVERALAFGASRHEAGKVVVKLGVRAALQRLMQHTGGPGLLLLPALAAGLLLAGVPPMLVMSCCGHAPCQKPAVRHQLPP
jgi:ABC-type iron transport system FetAB permease component